MISLSYSCKCGFATPVLDDAQKHANALRHHINVVGTITPNTIAIDAVSIARAARDKAFEAEVLRIARDKGLVKDGKR